MLQVELIHLIKKVIEVDELNEGNISAAAGKQDKLRVSLAVRHSD